MAAGVRIRVRGQVQGVGFRPTVWRIARELGLAGHVLNDPEGVLICAVGARVAELADAVMAGAPPLARIDAMECSAWDPEGEPSGFQIAESRGEGAETRAAPDAATCTACVQDVRMPGRRRGYAFTNCTHCGPRFSILAGLPYDRARTAMAGFPMCSDCRGEYDDPADRRFHAQPVACPACGPRLWLERDGMTVQGDPLALAAALLVEGAILAVKGLGGFHLACDAGNADAIRRLRTRKNRPTKPFALMADLATVRRHAVVDSDAEALLGDPAAPVVLLQARGTLPAELSPGLSTLGFMLPYTPLHHLLLDAVGRPLVMTSGNVSGEPQAIGNDEARAKLGGFADAFLMHDRDILRRLDDGVERIGVRGPEVLRRGRGRVPGTLALPEGFSGLPDVVAYGGHLKAAICLVKDGQALLSNHLGDLDDALTADEFRLADTDFSALFAHRPAIAACDLHPDYRSTRAAEARGLPVVRVQHHHAHLAACLGDNAHPRGGGPVAGIVLDGLGLGTDGTIWGGELLLGDYRDAVRVRRLRPAPLPGGEAAQREPWRNALMRLDAAGLPAVADDLFASMPRDAVRRAVAAGVNAPLSSSAGRLFDAVAAVLGLCPAGQGHEGEAAMRLEALAAVEAPPLSLADDGTDIDPAPLFASLVDGLRCGRSHAMLAASFHEGLAEAFAAPARRLVEEGRAVAVALSGGCLQNLRLARALVRALAGLPVYVHRRVPANDGGLAYGQALVALARLADAPERD